MSNQLLSIDFSKIKEASSWNNTKSKELMMHQIHVYPAKFPSFLVRKAINYIEKDKNAKINTIGDIFCGCGTTALEARLNKKIFWGCDINPVATLISKTKRDKYNKRILDGYRDRIFADFDKKEIPPAEILTHERLNYWFKPDRIIELYNLLESIKRNVPKGKYRNFYLVAFSNILKRTSMWLTKSIKPTIDKDKNPQPVTRVFKSQVKQMIKAAEESSKEIDSSFDSSIENKNFLSLNTKKSFLDLLITSPPYVTSYEYADLHQLSTLWLGYVKDYRELRNGTIGSVYKTIVTNEYKKKLNSTGKEIYEELLKTKADSKTSVLKYFLDMKATVKKSYSLIKKGGYAVFVIGNTKYKGVYINNAKYLAQCLIEAGFENPEIKKRKISSKKLTPYRDSNGKFSTDKRHRKVYSYEFILISKKA
jgi:DNA modification methylase